MLVHILVNPKGYKYWRLAYRFGTKQKTLALGVFPDVSLSQARKQTDEHKVTIKQGIDPGLIKKSKKKALTVSLENTFESVALEWFENAKASWSESHTTRSKRILEQKLFPAVGAHPIDSITPYILLAHLRQIEAIGTIDTAHRAKQVAGQVFRYAIQTERASRDPSADLKGALAKRKKTHFSAIVTPEGAAELMANIDRYSGTWTVKSALQLSALFFCRPGELRHLEWSEYNRAEKH